MSSSCTRRLFGNESETENIFPVLGQRLFSHLVLWIFHYCALTVGVHRHEMDLARLVWTTSLEMCGGKALEPAEGTGACWRHCSTFWSEKIIQVMTNGPELESNLQITTASETCWSALIFDKIKSHRKQILCLVFGYRCFLSLCYAHLPTLLLVWLSRLLLKKCYLTSVFSKIVFQKLVMRVKSMGGLSV